MSDNKLLSLSDIFNNRFFRIPDFQRGYSWGEQQLKEFWEDVCNLGPNKNHYIGLLTVDPIDKEEVSHLEKWQDDLWLFNKGMSAFYVIDGQQRLTTMIILISEILKTVGDDEGINYGYKKEWTDKFLYRSFSDEYKSFVFGYEKDNPSDEYFKTKILEQYSSSADKYPETLYTANLTSAKTFFSDKLKELTKEEKKTVFEKVVNRLKFNYYEIDGSLDVYVTFETMNNRGKELSKLELLKNRLIYLSTLLKESDEAKNRLRKDINETWKTIYEYLGKNKRNPLDDDDFLRNHWIMYFTYNRSQSGVFSNYLLKEKFIARNVLTDQLSLTDIKQYIDSLAICVKEWYYIFNVNNSPYSDSVKDWVLKLNRLGLGAFGPLLMAVFAKGKATENELVELLQTCERFNFLVFKVSSRQSNTQNSHFYRLARIYYFDQIALSGLIDNISWLTDGEDEEQYHGWFELDHFQNKVDDLFTKEEGYYSWNGLHYFLYEYETYLQSEADIKVTWEDFCGRKKEETIEHIYPQTANLPYWKERFNNYKPKERKRMLNSLGNLLLLSRSKNAKLQNFGFDDKKDLTDKEGKKIGYYNGSYSEIEVSRKREWKPKAIRDRGLDMLKFMEERWHFKFSDWNIKKEDILGLKDINF